MRVRARALVRWFDLDRGFEERFVEGELTDEHAACSYGQRVFVAADGGVWPASQLDGLEVVEGE